VVQTCVLKIKNERVISVIHRSGFSQRATNCT